MNEFAQLMEKVNAEGTVAVAPTQPRATTVVGQEVPAWRASDRAALGSKPLENLDRMINAATAKMTMGVSPVALAMSWFDWAAHLAVSPGKQFQLGQKALDDIEAWTTYAINSTLDRETPPTIEPSRDDHRFAHAGWKRHPFNLLAQGFLLTQGWWRDATTGVRGVSRHNEAAVSFVARQLSTWGPPLTCRGSTRK